MYLFFQITVADFYKFNWILGMDYYNIQLLINMQPETSISKIELLGQYDPSGEKIIEDPYCVKYKLNKYELFLFHKI